ncbi:MAG: MBL fold metallo-hydrolase, partial [Tumebacillaceae bacterium]
MTLRSVNAQQLHAMLAGDTELCVLDIRAPEAVASWKIEGAKQLVNVPFTEFRDGDGSVLQKLPDHKEICVVCARGISAQAVAIYLTDHGFPVCILEKGMSAWGQFYHPKTVAETDAFKLIQINRVGKGCLSYMVISRGEALVVDAGRHVAFYRELAAREGVEITHVVDTHLHADHISGGAELAKVTGATYFISSAEMHGANVAFEAVEQREQILFGEVAVKVLPIETPGHTPGSVSFLINEQFLLSGDTVFVGGLGRPDLGGLAYEWAQSLYDTVFTTIAALADEIMVLPAHYAGVEEINERGFVGAPLRVIRLHNELMKTVDREQFTERVAGHVGEAPPHYQQIVEINRG